ncbi:MAG: GNAT family N-acetyltransferase [Bacteroidota bacterium]
MDITLRKTKEADLHTLFIFQTDEVAIQMAAFTPKDPFDKSAYIEKWTGIVNNPEIDMQTILVNGDIAGSVVHFDMMGETNVSYWLGREYWGKGIATTALTHFISLTEKRPLTGRVAFDNIGSQKVLENCGFVKIRREKGFATARKKEIEEFVYELK